MSLKQYESGVSETDKELYEQLRQGEFCYVVASRQQTSSLRVRVMEQLQQEGVSCVAINVTMLGRESVQQFYTSLMSEILKQLGLPKEIIFGEWLEDRLVLTPLQQLRELIEEVVLVAVDGEVVIFWDEIDKTLSLPFSTDDLFGFIRACFNVRADKPEYGPAGAFEQKVTVSSKSLTKQ